MSQREILIKHEENIKRVGRLCDSVPQGTFAMQMDRMCMDAMMGGERVVIGWVVVLVAEYRAHDGR